MDRQYYPSFYRYTDIMGYCPYGILLSGSGQQDGIRRQRRSFHPNAAEGDSGSDNTDYIYSFHRCIFQRRNTALESLCRLCLPDCGGMARISQDIIIKKIIIFVTYSTETILKS